MENLLNDQRKIEKVTLNAFVNFAGNQEKQIVDFAKYINNK